MAKRVGRKKVTQIILTDEEIEQINAILNDPDAAKNTKQRCRILLALDESQNEGMTYAECAEELHCSRCTVTMVVRRFIEGRLDVVAPHRWNSHSGMQPMPEDLVQLIIETARNETPSDGGRWTFVKLADYLTNIKGRPISRTSVGNVLNQNGISLKK